MNAHLPDDHSSIHYYDGDYPGQVSQFPENFDPATIDQGIAYDVDRYQALADESPGGAVLELCCGTGRVAIPLARRGFSVTGIDISAPMLDRFRENLGREEPAVAERISLARGNVANFDLGKKFALIIAAFNSLLCLTRFEDQCAALAAAARHLDENGRLAIDVMNPLALPARGEPVPRPFVTRRNPHTGNLYTRFAALGPLGADQVQELFGWYDEVAPDGLVRRTPYSLHWRPIFRDELELMLERAGLAVESLEGGHHREPFTARSRQMFVVARRPSARA